MCTLKNYITEAILLSINYNTEPRSAVVASLAADPGIGSSIMARSHTFVEIDREMISTVILLLSLIQGGLLSVAS